jgi:hypothetical protein
LIEDATVPEHTRNDVHLPVLGMDSPYEDWTSQFNDSNLKISDKLIKENQKPIILSGLNQYFDNNAIFSNNNFFSKDTIFDKAYNQPIPIDKKTEQLSDGQIYQFEYGKIQNRNYKLLVDLRILGSTKIINSVSDPDHLITSDYWNFLSRQAVLSGTGVVKLFFDEVAKEKNSKIILSKNTSFFEKESNKLASIFFSVKSLFTGGQPASIITSSQSAAP